MIGAAFAKLVLSDISYQVSSLAFLRTSCTVPTLLQRRFFQPSLIKERGDSKRGNKKRHTTNKNGNSISLNNKRQHWVNDIMNSTKDETSTSEDSMSKLFKPVTIKPNPDDLNLGSEIAGKIERSKLIKTLNSFFQSQKTKTLSREQGLDDYLYDQACISFRKYTMDVTLLPPDLYILLSDILQGAIHEDSIFPYFLTHAKRVFPHLECLDELKLISDLSDPPMWYPDARSMKRKVLIFLFRFFFIKFREIQKLLCITSGYFSVFHRSYFILDLPTVEKHTMPWSDFYLPLREYIVVH